MKKGNTIKRTIAALMTLAMMTTLFLSGTVVNAATEDLKALKFEIEWEDNVTTSSILVARMGLSNTGAWPLNTLYGGEKLSYEVYIPSDGNYVYGMGGFDGQSGDLAASGYFWPASLVDQNGQPTHTQLDVYGTDKWIKREVTFATNTAFWHLGPSVISQNYDMTAFSGKKSSVYYRNIKIVSAGGERVIYDDSSSLTSYIVDGAWSFTGKAKGVTVTDGTYTFQKPLYNPADPTVPTGIGHAAELAMHFLPDYGTTPMPSPNAYDWHGFGSSAGAYSGLTLNTGDKLAYSIYIPSTSEYRVGMGLMDIQTTGNWAVLTWQPPYTDQNGNLFTTDLVATYGTDHWINLEYALPSALTQGYGIQHIGPKNAFSGTELDGLKGKSSWYYITNVRITHSNGTSTLIAPPTMSLYNVNPADDFVSPFAVVRNRDVSSFAVTFPYPASNANVISGLTENMSITSFMNGVVLANGVTLKILDRDMFEIAPSTTLATGQTVEIYIGTTLHNSYKILVYGDINGVNGISVDDLALIKTHMLNSSTLANLEFTAGDVTKDSKISISDLLILKKKLIGIGTISQS